MKKFSLVFLLPLASLFFAGCKSANSGNNQGSEQQSEEQHSEEQQKQDEVSISLDKKSASLVVGNTLQLTATVKNTTKSVSWSVSKGSNIVSVSNSGLVTALNAGSATVKATVDGKSATCNITVISKLDVVDATGVAVGELSPVIEINSTYQISAYVMPEDATIKDLKYKSFDETICTVNSTGLISALKIGKTDVRVESIGTPGIYKDIHVEVIEASVSLPSQTAQGFTKVTSGSLINGKAVEFISQTRGQVYGMNAHSSLSLDNHKGIECSIEGSKLVEDVDVATYKVVKNADGTYSFQNEDNLYLEASGGMSHNYLGITASITKTAKFKISFKNGFANIVCADEDTTRNTMCLNYNSGNPIFSCYAASQTDQYSGITLYQKDYTAKAEIVDIITVESQPDSLKKGEILDLNQVVLLCEMSDGTTSKRHPDDYQLYDDSGDSNISYWIGDSIWIIWSIKVIK